MENKNDSFNRRKNIKLLSLLSVSLISICTMIPVSVAVAGESHIELQKAPVDLSDSTSLQRGAKYFMNLCASCHSAEYMRYSRLAKDIKITETEEKNSEVLTDLVKTNLMFNTADINSHIKTSMAKNDAAKMFGISPPDLTMVTRVRGADWVYSYLKSFYTDPKRPWGVNNLVFKDVAMPNVLDNFQGQQDLVDNKLVLTKQGVYDVEQFDQMVTDITAFLSYAAEPYRAERINTGVWVLLFLAMFLVFAYLLKREYWKDVKK